MTSEFRSPAARAALQRARAALQRGRVGTAAIAWNMACELLEAATQAATQAAAEPGGEDRARALAQVAMARIEQFLVLTEMSHRGQFAVPPAPEPEPSPDGQVPAP
jgi:hypothetical protein